MARNGSGTYSNPYPDFISGTVISSTEVDANNSDIATALTQSIAVDGQSVVTGDIPLATHKFTAMKVGTASTDSLSLGQAQAEAFVWCATASGGADAITLSPSPAITAYAAGQRFVWMASGSTNTGATTVAISGLTAIALQDNGVALSAGQHAAGKMFMGILNTTSTVQIMQVQVSGTDPLIVSSLTVTGDATIGDDLTLLSDASILGFGENTDVTLTHVHDTGLLLNSTRQLQFNDASQYINAPTATVLDINATDEIELNATLADVNANLDVSGTYQGGGTMTTGGNIVIPDDGNIGSASDTDAIAISSAGVVALSATTEASATATAALTTAGGLGVAKDVWIGDDLVLASDGAKISWGADSEIELTHYHDHGLYLKDTGDSEARLTLQTGNTSVADGDNIGEIRFQAPDEAAGTDAIVTCASIRAQATDTFAADNNSTELQFMTSESGTRSTKMTVGHDGTITFGAPGISGDSDEEGWQYHRQGRIYQSSDVAGWIMNDSGSSGTYNYIVFRYNGSQIGDIDTTNNSTIRYNTFTGAHWSQFSDGSQAELKLGTVLSTVSDLITWTEFDYTDAEGQADIVRAAGHDYTIGDTYNIPVDERGGTGDCVAKRKKTANRLPKCEVSDTAGDTAVYGVFSGHYQRGESSVEALGSGIILIGSGVSLNIGDLLESAGDGTARPQTGSDAAVFKSSTIAKVTSTTKVDTHSDGSFTVPCTLHCG